MRLLRKPPGRAHPHTRGDDVKTFGVVLVGLGSPPHAWGRPHWCDRG